ncbi:TM2 domain-containing protein [Streptomyces boncukensis]|uniref:NINE protein n=1 Tax=Streptomyces boncukensis TaxID=2711219 RepID=A0A6G4WQM4_9ACTN|nr:TM2 domain-containing protein [Streptomyces boncukensis]NGO67132.1 NINE protein [Streptomyces boncukensis]
MAGAFRYRSTSEDQVSNPQQPGGYGYPQQPGQNPYAQQPGAVPGQPAYGYPQQAPMGGAPAGYDPNAPYGYDPYGRPLSNKSKIVAGVLQLFIGTLGIGRFYTGHVGMGIGQLLTCGGLGIWALIDGIMFLVSDSRTDAEGRVLRG